ncbi:MAG: SDR family NAD(P)-dependent oxidoreductase [Anaerolineaceae bacterium]|nr:SDR family NAD(P)-dependent oxidoreductase [Anaerolineaceae bacterium]
MLNKLKPIQYENPGKAFISGASSGLGASFAQQLAFCGFDLVLLARREERLKAIASQLESEYSIQCEILLVDLSNPKEIEDVAKHISQMDNLDVLVNCAGFATLGKFIDVPINKSMGMFHVHMTAPVYFTHAALQNMQKRKRGIVINVSSMGALSLTPGNVVYDSTKSFLNTFSENITLEIDNPEIKIQALCPGFTSSEFHSVGDFVSYDKSAIPNSFWMTPDEVVSLSLDALKKSRKIIFVPGWKNKLFLWFVQYIPPFRKAIQNSIKKRDSKYLT